MKNAGAKTIPSEYMEAVNQELRGSVQEVSYKVSHYINPSRQLVTNRNLDSEEAGRETVAGDAIMKKCNIYLPAGYDHTDTETRYNVLYLLHGVGGNHFDWLSGNGSAGGNFILCNLFDNLIAKGDIEPLIVVFPNGRSAVDWTDNSFNAAGTNMLGFYYFDYELRYDLIPFIESEYRTYADITDASSEGVEYNRMHRAIAGLSMGGMQALNIILGGYRCDSSTYTGNQSRWKNGLEPTVLAPGMTDLFAYVGSFSNAPTSSGGQVLGSSIASSGRKLELLYLTCGDADDVSKVSYADVINGLEEAAGDSLRNYYQVLMKDCGHDFRVWNNGAYNFSRLSFGFGEERMKPSLVMTELQV